MYKVINFKYIGRAWSCSFYFKHISEYIYVYIKSAIQKDGLHFVRLYFLNSTWYVDDLHNI